jgi:hypothetical protein
MNLKLFSSDTNLVVVPKLFKSAKRYGHEEARYRALFRATYLFYIADDISDYEKQTQKRLSFTYNYNFNSADQKELEK